MNTNLSEIATVSDTDPNKEYSPSPVYYISESSCNNDYFELTTTASGFANIAANKFMPFGDYTLTVYAQFASVTDYGYVTNTPNVTLNIHVEGSVEIVLEDNIHKLLD